MKKEQNVTYIKFILVGIILFIFIYRLYHSQIIQQQKEEYVTFFTPGQLGDIQPYPSYIRTPALRTNQKFIPEVPSTTFHLYLPPDLQSTHTQWFNNLLQEYLTVQPYTPLRFKTHYKLQEWSNAMKEPMTLGAIPATILQTLRTNQRKNRDLQGVITLYSFSLFIVIPTRIAEQEYQWNRNLLKLIERIGLGPENGLADQWFRKILTVYTSSDSTNKYIYGNYQELAQKLKDDKIDAIIWADTTPGDIWYHFQEDLPTRSYGLIEIQLNKNEQLGWADPNMRTTYFDLQKFNTKYLPVTFSGKTYSAMNPMIETIATPMVWVASSDFPRDDLFQWLELWLRNYQHHANNPWFKASRWTLPQAFDFGPGLTPHAGSAKWMILHGLQTAQASELCKDYASHRVCPYRNEGVIQKEFIENTLQQYTVSNEPIPNTYF